MSDQALATDQSGIQRTETGEIADQGKPLTTTTTTQDQTTNTDQNTQQDTSTQSKDKGSDKSLLNQGDKKPESETKGAPDAYSDYKVPDGFEIDKDVITEANGIFKDLGLPQDSAQRLVDFYIKQSKEAAEQPFKAYQDMRNGWREEAANHPQLRNRLEGENSPVKQSFGKLMAALGDNALADSFKQAMDLTGAGDHPAFIRVVDILGSLLTEGTHVKGGGPSKEGQARPGAGPPTAAKALYPNLP